MGIIDKVKNSKIAKSAAKKANDYMNSDKNENQNKESDINTNKTTEKDKSQGTNLNNLKNKI